MGFKHIIITQSWKWINLHTHEPLIDSDHGVFCQEPEEQLWQRLKIKCRIKVNQSSKYEVNNQWGISSWMVTRMCDEDEWNYLIKIDLRVVLRWLGTTQVRCREGELGLGKVWVVFKDDFWVVIWNWDALNLKNWNIVLRGSTRVRSKVFLALEAWRMNGKIPLFILKVMECFRRGECEGFPHKGVEL